jgi:uncharacterized protein
MGAYCPHMNATDATHVGAVAELYAAFGRGDVPSILALLSDDVRWEHWADSSAQSAGLESLAERTGPAEVAGFFEHVGQWEVTEFQVLDLMGSESQVVAEVVIAATLPGGGRFRDEELHLWGFDADGKINRMRHYVDTAKHIAAERGEDTL